MEPQWHYVQDGKTVGPVAIAELRSLVEQGVLRADDLVWHDGMDEWASVESQRLVPPSPPPIPPPTGPPVSQRRKKTSRPKATVAPKAVIWSVVGVVAVILCGAWWYAGQPKHPKRQVARPSPSKQKRQQRESASTPKRETREREVTADVIQPATIHPDLAHVAQAIEKPVHATRAMPEADPAAIASKDNPATEPPETKPAKASLATPDPPSPTANTSPATISPSGPITIYQRVDIQRSPAYSMSGLEMKQSLHYQVSSQLEVNEASQPGFTNVTQIVLDTRLIEADATSKASIAKALEDLKRQQYTYRLNHLGEVIKFTGHKKNLTTLPVDISSGTGFQLTSVIDEDGWKELAELTFVRPPKGLGPSDKWQRQMQHDWGSLGSWSGLTTFQPQSATEDLRKIAFTREMKYRPPTGGSGGLPFKIDNAKFEIERATGTVDFDTAKNRVLQATEDFQVKGNVTAGVAGTSVNIQLTETQRIKIDISDQRASLQ